MLSRVFIHLSAITIENPVPYGTELHRTLLSRLKPCTLETSTIETSTIETQLLANGYHGVDNLTDNKDTAAAMDTDIKASLVVKSVAFLHHLSRSISGSDKVNTGSMGDLYRRTRVLRRAKKGGQLVTYIPADNDRQYLSIDTDGNAET